MVDSLEAGYRCTWGLGPVSWTEVVLCVCVCVCVCVYVCVSVIHFNSTHSYVPPPAFPSGALDAPFNFCAMILKLKAFPNSLSMVLLSFRAVMVKNKNKAVFRSAESARWGLERRRILRYLCLLYLSK